MFRATYTTGYSRCLDGYMDLPVDIYLFDQCVKPILAVRADDVAESSPWRGPEARVPCSRPHGRRKPSTVLSRI